MKPEQSRSPYIYNLQLYSPRLWYSINLRAIYIPTIKIFLKHVSTIFWYSPIHIWSFLRLHRSVRGSLLRIIFLLEYLYDHGLSEDPIITTHQAFDLLHVICHHSMKIDLIPTDQIYEKNKDYWKITMTLRAWSKHTKIWLHL